LAHRLARGDVECHPFVIGELACGNLSRRDEVLALLSALPSVRTAQHDEVLGLLDANRLFGRGLGWVDVHLLASTLLTRTTLWTLDQGLTRCARELGVSSE
jgi:hypothetical protein